MRSGSVAYGSLKRRKFLFALLALALALPTAVPYGRTLLASQESGTPAGDLQPKVVSVWATPAGFNPREIKIRPGTHRLRIYNGTGLENLQFVATRADEGAIPVPVLSGVLQHGRSLSDLVLFTPGVVTIREPTHPNWECTITVEP